MISWSPEPIRVNTPLGKGYVLFVDGSSDDNWFTIALDNCAIVTFKQSKIRMCRNYTLGRNLTDDEMKEIVK